MSVFYLNQVQRQAPSEIQDYFARFEPSTVYASVGGYAWFTTCKTLRHWKRRLNHERWRALHQELAKRKSEVLV